MTDKKLIQDLLEVAKLVDSTDDLEPPIPDAPITVTCTYEEWCTWTAVLNILMNVTPPGIITAVYGEQVWAAHSRAVVKLATALAESYTTAPDNSKRPICKYCGDFFYEDGPAHGLGDCVDA